MIRRLAREPLLHFVLLGAALFALYEWVGDPARPDDDRIVVTPGRIEHLAAGFERTWQRPPTQEELQGLIDSHIREEIYYREALALGLAEDDGVVRRRMQQKLEFLTADAAETLDPSDEDLRAYLRDNPDRFRRQPQVAFRHVYLNPERHPGDGRQAALALLERLRAEEPTAQASAALGDRLPLPAELGLARRSEVQRLFGRRFAERVLEAAPGRWTGPIESGYGLHLVHVGERREARLPALGEVRALVLREWLNDRRAELGEAFYRSLRQRYTVVVQAPASRGIESAEADSIVSGQ